MRNVFLLYMPPNNPEAMTHYRDTIQNRVPFERIARFLTRAQSEQVRGVFGSKPIAVWGSRDGPHNRARFEKMRAGDDVLIVEGDHVRLLGKAAFKIVSPDLSHELWKNIKDPREPTGWDLVYFIANPLEVDVAWVEVCRLFGWSENFRLQGFASVSDEKLRDFYSRYDDLYSILIRIRDGRAPEARTPVEPTIGREFEQTAQSPEQDPVPVVSEHVRMQRLLARLGRKAGHKVWVPRSDQSRVLDPADDVPLEEEFAAGIDLPKTYVENIDVVWKDEFRIDAAFEIENSTAIYSGLLRFADLRIIAPNSTYPMFIVAPSERRNRVREQLCRPVFKRLDMRDKVRFLPYEAIEEIDRFFAAGAGLSAKVMEGKSERLEC